MDKEINILHLYPSILATYGDGGNIESLRYQAGKCGYTANLYTAEIGEEIDNWADIDIVFIGGGQDMAQLAVSRDIQRHRKALTKHYNAKKIIFTICGGYQLLGEYFVTSGGERIEGLNIVPIQTTAGNHRAIGYSSIRLNEDVFPDIGNNNIVIGFENHSGMTMTPGIKALGTIMNNAKGNNGSDGHEGIVSKNMYGTYLHGPILALNPHLRDHLLRTAIKNKYPKDKLELPKHEFERMAYEEALSMI